MHKFWTICFLFFVVSCDLFESRETKIQKLVNKEMLSIDWNDVDQYPLFDNCDEFVSKPIQLQCFQDTLLKHFSATLKDFEFDLKTDLVDTLYLDFVIDNKGSIRVLDIEKNQELLKQIPEFNGVITQSLKTLPHLAPAIKRGIPVTAKFRIPIIVNTK